MAEYFAGNRKGFTVALGMQGTGFQKMMWYANTAYGKIKRYAEQAQAINKPTTVRAIVNQRLE